MNILIALAIIGSFVLPQQYDVIVKDNLFLPLGSGGEIKQEFTLIGIVGKSAFIKMSGKTFFRSKWQMLDENTRLVAVGKDCVIIIHKNNMHILELLSR